MPTGTASVYIEIMAGQKVWIERRGSSKFCGTNSTKIFTKSNHIPMHMVSLINVMVRLSQLLCISCIPTANLKCIKHFCAPRFLKIKGFFFGGTWVELGVLSLFPC